MSERLLITCSVYAILILDILHSIIVTAVGWQVLCQGWGRTAVLDNPGWAFPWTPIVTGIGMSPIPLHDRRRHVMRLFQLPSWYKHFTPGGSIYWVVGRSFQLSSLLYARHWRLCRVFCPTHVSCYIGRDYAIDRRMGDRDICE